MKYEIFVWTQSCCYLIFIWTLGEMPSPKAIVRISCVIIRAESWLINYAEVGSLFLSSFHSNYNLTHWEFIIITLLYYFP